MALFSRGVPAGVRARLERGERVLAHAPVTAPAGEDTPVLAATTRALHLPDGRTVPWQDIDQARWTPDAFTFLEEGSGEHTVGLRSDSDSDGVDYRRLAETVSERVTATILVNRFVPFPSTDSTTGFRLVARRPPGGTDVAWRIHLGEGVDPRDERLSDAVSRALDALHDQMGV
ncbi:MULTISPECIES: hypothetical protein [Nocardiopsis]|uniref:Uncharacterized protein n=1 Tax=Nocardiopsis sinuspersici TaxID=501010 RepID=A0A1V3BXC1_9ACTN|nr:MULTISPECIES: hypothetical protein [Nocardiopsis]OOC53053.1 hypothetical protein NOSIN_03800 [Nocardiopsis sinuspersici]